MTSYQMYSIHDETIAFQSVFSLKLQDRQCIQRTDYEITSPFTDHMLRIEKQKVGLGKSPHLKDTNLNLNHLQ